MYYNLTFLLLTYFNAYYTSIIRIIFVLKPVHIDGLNGLLVCNIELSTCLDLAFCASAFGKSRFVPLFLFYFFGSNRTI